MIKTKILSLLIVAGFLGGCENMTMGQKGAVTGAALGTGIAAVAGGSFGAVVGAGLIGGAAGYITGSASATSNGGHDAQTSRRRRPDVHRAVPPRRSRPTSTRRPTSPARKRTP